MIIKDNQTTPKFDYWKFLSLFSIPTFFLDPGLRRGDDILVISIVLLQKTGVICGPPVIYFIVRNRKGGRV